MFAFCSCRHEKTPVEVIREHIGRRVVINGGDSVYNYSRDIACTFEELIDKYDYLSLVYVDRTCAVCRAALVEWMDNADKVEKIAPDKYNVLFIYRGEDDPRKYVEINLGDASRFPFYVLPDADFGFLLSNDIADDVLDASVLIDKKCKIRLVGEPFVNGKIEDLYRNVIEGKELQ